MNYQKLRVMFEKFEEVAAKTGWQLSFKNQERKERARWLRLGLSLRNKAQQ